MPKALLDLRMVRGRLHGIARYALELARRLPRFLPADWRLVGLTGPEGLPGDLGPLAPELMLETSRGDFLSPLEQPLLAAALMRSGCDLFHATSFSVPAFWPGALVATIHDANHLALAEEYGPGRTLYYRAVVGPRARKARALIAPSEFARDEVAHHLSIDPYRFQVIAQGVSERFRPAADSDVARFRHQHGLPQRYLAAVGNPKPFKNLTLLSKISEQLPAPIALLAGPGTAAACGFNAKTIDLGGLPESDLPVFYSGAAALLLPSRYEGFGLPALEAMACGCPVIASRAGALPEVVGEAGMLAAPDAPQEWLAAVQRLLRDERWHAQWVERGIERAARFSWDDCARQTAAVYQRALERR